MTIPTAIAHDYLTQRGGAERVVLALGEIWPLATIYTSLYDPHGTFPEFARDEIHTAFVNRIRPLRSRHRLALPVLAPSFSSMRIDAEVTVCSSSGWAHGVHCTGAKVVYCHAPARWLHQVDAYTSESSVAVRMALAGLRRPLLSWDRRAAHSADVYVVNSTRTRDLVREAYGIDAEIIHPPHNVDTEGPLEPIDHVEPGFFLCVSRLLPYKNLEALLHGFAQMPSERLVIVGSGPDRDRLISMAPNNVAFLSDIPDSQLRWLYRSAVALLAVGLEDFGLTPIEAASFGLPTLARAFGGYLDTVVEGVNGYFLGGLDPADLAEAVRRLKAEPLDPAETRRSSERFSAHEFSMRLGEVVEQVRAGGLP
jgi:glycosyltransferase involved in cell wall biosynthesis